MCSRAPNNLKLCLFPTRYDIPCAIWQHERKWNRFWRLRRSIRIVISHKTSSLEPFCHLVLFLTALRNQRAPKEFLCTRWLLTYHHLDLIAYGMCFALFNLAPFSHQLASATAMPPSATPTRGSVSAPPRESKEMSVNCEFLSLCCSKGPCSRWHRAPTCFNDCIYDVCAHLFLLTVD